MGTLRQSLSSTRSRVDITSRIIAKEFVTICQDSSSNYINTYQQGECSSSSRQRGRGS